MINLSETLNLSIFNQNEQEPSSFWERKSKDTDFVDDLKKQPILHKLIRYDTKFNNKRKVEFESSLAGVIRIYPRMLQVSVIKVAKAISDGLISSLQETLSSLQEEQNWFCQHLYSFFSENPYIKAEYSGELSPGLEEKEKFISWIYNKLHSLEPKDFHCQLLLIREYGNFFLRPYAHLPTSKDKDWDIQISSKKSVNKMKELWEASRTVLYEKCSPLTSRVKTNRSKDALMGLCGIFDDQSTYDTKRIKKYCPKVFSHLPGKHLWFVNSISDFTQRVRFDLDMPIIASQGGSIALLLIPAIVMGNLNDEELRLFNLGAISYLISNGHHSLHEFKTIWNFFNIPYVDGYYRSLFPRGIIESHLELSELQIDFSDLI